MIKKAIETKFKDVDTKQGIVMGYFSIFGTKDHDGDIIVKGAYENTLRERGVDGKNLIAHLLDHDQRKAVGVIQVLKEDDIGLYYETKAGRHTLGRDFLYMAEDGIIKNHSVGFSVVSEERKKDANYMYELKLMEGSSLQFLGAHEDTPIVGVKSFEDSLEFLKTLRKSFRDNKHYTDETFIAIEKEIDLLKEELKQYVSKNRDEVINVYDLNYLYK